MERPSSLSDIHRKPVPPVSSHRRTTSAGRLSDRPVEPHRTRSTLSESRYSAAPHELTTVSSAPSAPQTITSNLDDIRGPPARDGPLVSSQHREPTLPSNNNSKPSKRPRYYAALPESEIARPYLAAGIGEESDRASSPTCPMTRTNTNTSALSISSSVLRRHFSRRAQQRSSTTSSSEHSNFNTPGPNRHPTRKLQPAVSRHKPGVSSRLGTGFSPLERLLWPWKKPGNE